MKLDPQEIRQAAAGSPVGWAIEVVDETASTNDAVRDLGMRGAQHGRVVFAEQQLRGRGRRQNRWLSAKGRDLMFSVLLRPESPPELWPRITTLAALAICKAIEAELPLQPEIKWPNDVYLNDRKVSGLLAESFSGGTGLFLVLGIGINVNSREFPPELQSTATSLAIECANTVIELDRSRLAGAILRTLGDELGRLTDGFGEAMREARERSWLLGKTVRATVDGRELFGRAIDLNHEGHLVLALPDGSISTLGSAEEVRWVV